MNLNEYSTWLIEFSDKYTIADDVKLTVYIAGLIEELNEYNLADTIEGKKEELGDVLAYLVLALNKVGFPLIAVVNKFDDSELTVSHLSMRLAGFLKRLYRGDNEITDCVFTLISYHDFIVDELTKLNLTIDELIEINVSKLTKRDVNNTLKGNGDNR
jgi:hypothetical protein